MAPFPPVQCRAELFRACPDLRHGIWHPLSGGRVNRLWRVGDLVVKLFRPEAATPLFPNDAKAEALILRDLAGSGLAPTLVAAGADWIVYHHCQGQCWQIGTPEVASTLGAIHRRSPPPGLRHLPIGPKAIVAAETRGPIPDGLPTLPQVTAPTPARQVLVHGDVVPGNLIAAPDRIVVIDWQCPGAGDPVDDLATFLSPAMQWLYRGAPLSAAETQAFLSAYPDRDTVVRYHALRPLLHWRIAAHCARRAAEGAADYARALPLELGMLG